MTTLFLNAFNNPLPGKEAQRYMSPSVRFTGYGNPNPKLARESSVLIMLFVKNGEWHIPLIKRPEYKGAHSGQISLPGGKTEEGDNSYLQTAIRETEEEIGIDGKEVQFLGELTSLFIPNSNFIVYPQVGLYNSAPVFRLDEREVESIIEVPISELLNPANVKSFSRRINEVQVDAPYYSYNEYVIWGATAMILSEFLQVLKRNNINPLLHSYSDCSAQECQ